jgi:hypothetical protein
MGLEPTNGGTTILCLNHLATLAIALLIIPLFICSLVAQTKNMKNLPIITYVGVAALAGIGITMAVTNPSLPAYEAYAVQWLTEYLKSDVCPQVPEVFGDFLQRNCSKIVDSSQAQMRLIITQATQQQNFILFSIYRTNLSVNPLLPSYQFETVGVFHNFYTYSAERQ